MVILGINAYHGDVSAALLEDGKLIAAVEEERFRRVKHWAGFPREAILSCLKIAGIPAGRIDRFAVSRNPKAHLLRKACFLAAHRPGSRFLADRVKNRRRIWTLPERVAEELGLEEERVRSSLHWVEHHPAHLASAFFASPFEESAVCAVDGFGDFVSTSWALGKGSGMRMLRRVYFPHSLGLLYLALTQYLGFLKYGDEYKVMGLAAYGKPAFADSIRRLLRLTPDGGFELDLAFFQHSTGGAQMTWDDGEPQLDRVYTPRLEQLLGPARRPEEPLEPRHEDIAASVQQVFEEALFHSLNALHRATRSPRLCFAGGCAMNSLANGKIRERTPFRELFIQPAAADNGTSLGAALSVWNRVLGQPRRFIMEHAYWGPEFSVSQIAGAIQGRRGLIEKICAVESLPEEELLQRVARRLAEGKVVGWFQGRMEWGARALGNRSILADPRRSDMREIINTKIKFRERFRPFAPAVEESALDDFFVKAVPDPFMIQVYPVRPDKRGVIPAVTHVDGTGRLQTVREQTNPVFWRLLQAFKGQTGVPVLLNTSFNENEPIVHQPEEALDCFLRTRMDVLVLGTTILEKH